MLWLLWLNYIAMLLAGFFTKFTDNLVDERFLSPKFSKYFTALLYGTILGYLISASGFSALIVGAILGVLLFGRIDNKAHQIALFSTIFVGVVFGIPQLNIFALLLFTIASWLDEWLNDNSKNFILKQRPVLILACLIASIYFGVPAFFLAIAFFDVGYFLSEFSMEKFLKKFEAKYGPQLTIDCYKCEEKAIAEKTFVKNFLLELVELIEMKKISDVILVDYVSEKIGESGISGFVLIAESHVSMHTYPKRKLVKIDVVSCKKFDNGKAIDFCKKKLKSEDVSFACIDRGKEYPKDIETAKEIALKERQN